MLDASRLNRGQVFPSWLEAPKGAPSTSPSQAAEDARKLVQWCHDHNGGVLVAALLRESVHEDPKDQAKTEGRRDMCRVLRYLKDAAEGPKAAEYEEAFEVMGKAFGPGWRRGEGARQ